MTRGEIEARLLAWMREEPQHNDEARFAELALALFAFQFRHCAPYGRWCAARGATPSQVANWREIPAVPAGAFKELALRSFAAAQTRRVFRSSGTTLGQRSELHLDTLALYEASLLPSFERGVLPDLGPGERIPMLVLAEAPQDAPDSSLSHMFGALIAQRGAQGSGFFLARGQRGQRGELLQRKLLRALEEAAAEARPVALCGTALALAHFCEALDCDFPLPAGSRIMETGGFKGRRRDAERGALYENLTRRFAVPAARIVNQYGMTELGSQFYDSVLAEPAAPRRKVPPPWTRVRMVDPLSGAERPPGATGAIEIVDLANTGSICAICTADLGRALHGGFEVLGRAPGAEARGCSIAADEMLAESTP
ncbi:MAG: long-chain fatty acid--CoA ligase [Deltaproteobacteria bacterium]|nr:long-chain fatty acid--CoA ligase [Deltaproteobacteria bacterium]